MRALVFRSVKLLAALVLPSACELHTEGQREPGLEDGGTWVAPALDCTRVLCLPDASAAASSTRDASVREDASVPGDARVAHDSSMSVRDASSLQDARAQHDADGLPLTCSPACATGSHCELSGESATCVQDPAPPTDASVPPADASADIPCGNNTCSADQVCCSEMCGLCASRSDLCHTVECSPPDASVPPVSCASTSCPAGTYCDDTSGVLSCIPNPSCAGVDCGPGATCQLVNVVCVRAPCPPVPECIPMVPPTCMPPCSKGSQCIVSGSTAICEVVPTGGTCGTSTCNPGQVCCSASCGMCGSKNGVCSAIACPLTQN